ncbi:YciI family protein [Psychrobacillus sp. FSL H8-0484]|uniref:YciI family protein n=1 Tax=Psychrobacillus sp. FSL H8-0484 TaxID=2921390 RepID=UPI0030F59B8C
MHIISCIPNQLRHYLVDTLKDRLLSAGPFMDHTGGLVIVEVESVQEAEEIAKNDPEVLEEKFEYVVHPWEPLEGLFTKSK